MAMEGPTVILRVYGGDRARWGSPTTMDDSRVTRSELPTVSVIIPALDEAQRLGAQLASLSRVEGLHELIVVDGGSSDRTCDIASGFGGVQLLHADRGRALQMNAGARHASGEVLMFLHVDVALPPDAISQIHATLAQPETVAGAFRTWTVNDTTQRFLAPLLHLADLRSRYTGLPYGDQAIFVRAEAFRRVGGFPGQPILEDVELCRRLRQLGKIRTTRARVNVSGRRVVARPLYYAAIFNLVPLLYRLGLPPQMLSRLYPDVR